MKAWTAAGIILVLVATAAPAAGQERPKKQKATVEQVASVVAENRADVEDAIATFDLACTPFDCSGVGGLTALTLGITATTLVTTLDAIDDRTARNRLYQGTIPKKIRKLYRETLSAARGVQQGQGDFTTCSTSLPPGSDPAGVCSVELNQLSFAASTLERKLGAWDAYL